MAKNNWQQGATTSTVQGLQNWYSFDLPPSAFATGHAKILGGWGESGPQQEEAYSDSVDAMETEFEDRCSLSLVDFASLPKSLPE